MYRFQLTVFTIILLLAQWGSFEHAYHEHDSGEVCDYCLTSQALDHVVTPAIQFVFTSSFHQILPRQVLGYFSISAVRYYATRAPPRYI